MSRARRRGGGDPVGGPVGDPMVGPEARARAAVADPDLEDSVDPDLDPDLDPDPDLDADLDAVAALRHARHHDEHRSEALALAARAPSRPRARLEAAYALDQAGDEAAAIRHYDAAWRLGVPEDERRRFVVGYGSTLRNVGRADEAVVLLTEELGRDPGYPPLVAFLALALHSAGHASAALATMLACVLDVAEHGRGAEHGDVTEHGRGAAAAGRPHPLDGYQRALGDYYRELIDESAGKRRT